MTVKLFKSNQKTVEFKEKFDVKDSSELEREDGVADGANKRNLLI